MKFKKRVLSNGITILHESRDLPVVSLAIANKFGASHETSKVKGIAHFIEHLLFTGTKTRTHEDISGEIEKKGGILNAFTAQDLTAYWFKLPSEHIFTGLDILADMLNFSVFPEKKFEKEKKVVLEEIKMYHDMPQRNIYDKIVSNLYENPFGEGISGSEKTLKNIQRDFVMDYFDKHYSPENYIVSIVGMADFEAICDYLEKKFTPKNKKYSPLAPKKKNSHTTETRPGIDQAHFVFAVHAPMADDERRYVLEVLDAYLANGMSSQLFLEIRERHGLAYNVSSNINTEKTYSYYTIYVGTRKEAVSKVKALILKGFEDIKKMSSKDLKEAKERLIGLRRITSEESSNVMTELLYAEFTGKAEDYYRHEKKIRSVSLKQVKSLAKSLIKNYSTAAIVPK